MDFFKEYYVLVLCLPYILAEICTDVSPQASCEAWKALGECSTHVGPFYCKKTCNLCGTVPETQPPPTMAPTNPNPNTDHPSPGVRKCGVSLAMKGKIVGGTTASQGAWPWIASLQKFNSHFCGGTLIRENWVLTAAHCVEQMITEGVYNYYAVLGAHNVQAQEASQQRMSIKRVISHHNYNKQTLKADFALLELNKPVMLNQRVQLACLPDSANQPPALGTMCYLAGWGSVQHPGQPHPVLQQTKLPVVASYNCKHNNEVVCVGKGYGSQSNGSQQPNACRGDSGGPLVCQNSNGQFVLHGAASYVVEYCKYYTGYSPVHSYYSWIMQNIS